MYIKLVIAYFLVSVCYTQDITKIEGATTHKVEKSGWTISVPEAKALEEFRPLVAQYLFRDEERTDGFLIRWLRANDLDVAKAELQLHEAQNWRKENKIDSIINETILDWKPEPFDYNGFDREGHPVFVTTVGLVDIRKFVIQGNGKLFLRSAIQTIERALARRGIASEMFGKNITKILVIVDYKGFSLRQHACLSCVPYLQDLAIIIEKYYPEILKEFILINVPRIAIPVLQLLNSLAPRTEKLMRFFGPDRAEWANYLSQIISPDQLLYQLGGTRKI